MYKAQKETFKLKPYRVKHNLQCVVKKFTQALKTAMIFNPATDWQDPEKSNFK